MLKDKIFKVLLLIFGVLFIQTAHCKEEKIIIKSGSNSCSASLVNNKTTALLKLNLPIAITLTDLNHNEKYGNLPFSLPTQSFEPQKIKKGDIYLFGKSTLVIFYDSFITQYRYTALGMLDNPDCLDALTQKTSLKIEITKK